MSSILHNFLTRVESDRDRELFTIINNNSPVSLTHRQLLDGGSRYASILKNRGANPGDVVLISLKLEPDFIFAFLGSLLAGCVPSMMPFPSAKQDPALFWSSHDDLFRHIGGGFFITFDENVEQVQANITPDLLTILTPADAAHASGHAGAYEWTDREICCLQHSSGTTGLKKGVTLTSRAIVDQLDSYAASLGLEDDDTIVSWLPLYHDMGFVATLLMPLVRGNHSVIMSPFEWLMDPVELFRLIERYDGKFVWLPNFAFNHLARSMRGTDNVDLSGVKAFINCSEPCKVETFDTFLATFERFGVRREQLQVSYAMAETVFAVTQTRIGAPVRSVAVSQRALREEQRISLEGTDLIRLLSTGHPIDGMEVRIVGGEVGEIALKGDFVFGGYYKTDSAQAFQDGYYLTGDLGFLVEGELYVLGRTKDMIIVLGKNFFANEIEAILNTVAGIKPGRAVALGIYNPEIGSEDPIIVAELDGSAEVKSIRSEMKRKLESTIGLVPKKIAFVEPGWLVKSTSGKISRSENISKYIREFASE
ncbi:AMP-binding protein [Caballeronia sp. dw_19]|uniref:AMP-binding protein n=1 Tax=Caballeronia sp. dw_19 TaxID=2719791 RepID=UPI001BD37260|nr:AMP-binding protein [Caballeronia sp. dw_19]